MKRTTTMVMVIAVAICLLCGCGKKEINTEYYISYPALRPVEQDVPYETEEVDISDEQRKVCEEIYQNVASFYNIEKEVPVFRKLMISLGDGNMRGNAYFDSIKNVIYVSDTATEKDKAVIAHEVCHYLSDGKTDAMGIRIGDFWSGQYFIEGCTTYLSSKVYPFPKGLSVYEFETHCAEMVAQAYGEDEFIKCYFNGGMENIREDFNNTLASIYPNEMYQDQVPLTPFDVYVGNLNMYYLLLNSITPEEMQDQLEFLGALVDSCEETSQIYNSLKGKDATGLTKNFVKNEFMIPWSMITHMAQM